MNIVISSEKYILITWQLRVTWQASICRVKSNQILLKHFIIHTSVTSYQTTGNLTVLKSLFAKTRQQWNNQAALCKPFCPESNVDIYLIKCTISYEICTWFVLYWLIVGSCNDKEAVVIEATPRHINTFEMYLTTKLKNESCTFFMECNFCEVNHDSTQRTKHVTF